MARILVIEPHFSGHRGAYLIWSVNKLIARGALVCVATSSGSCGHRVWTELHGIRDENSNVLTLLSEDLEAPSKGGGGLVRLIARDLVFWRFFRRCYRRSLQEGPIDVVFVLCGDRAAYSLAVLGSPFGPVPWGCIMMQSSFHFSDMHISGPVIRGNKLRRSLFERMLHDATMRFCFSDDPSLLEYVADAWPGSKAKVHLLIHPQVISGGDREKSRRALDISAESFVVLCYGSMGKRKGLDLLIEAFARVDVSQPTILMIAGTHKDSSVERALSSPAAKCLLDSNQLRVIPYFLDGEEENRVFRAADLIWLGYREHSHMSGVLTQAASAGLPVISSREGVIGWLSLRHELGPVFDFRDPEHVAIKLSKIINDPDCAAHYRSRIAAWRSSVGFPDASDRLFEEITEAAKQR